MKTLIIFAFVGLLSIATVSCRKHDLELGSPEPGQRLVKADHVKKDKPPLLPVSIKEKKTYTAPSGFIITQIRSIDQKFKNDNGASVSVVAGGTGENFVTLEYQSQTGHSIDHKVEIYAREKPYQAPPSPPVYPYQDRPYHVPQYPAQYPPQYPPVYPYHH